MKPVMDKFIKKTTLLVVCVLLLTDCASARPVLSKRYPGTQVGVASYLDRKFHGRKTASGEIYNQNKLTAAHRSYPLGTQVRVTNLKNGKSVALRINDRGPYIRGRIMDVSRRAAKELGFVHQGLTKVKIEVLSMGG